MVFFIIVVYLIYNLKIFYDIKNKTKQQQKQLLNYFDYKIHLFLNKNTIYKVEVIVKLINK